MKALPMKSGRVWPNLSFDWCATKGSRLCAQCDAISHPAKRTVATDVPGRFLIEMGVRSCDRKCAGERIALPGGIRTWYIIAQ